MPTPYMIRRHQTWYVRVRIPHDLRAILGMHIVRSLKTSDRMIANQRAIGLVSEFHGIWMDIRKKLADQIRAVHAGESTTAELKQFVQDHATDFDALPADIRRGFYNTIEFMSTNLSIKNRQEQNTTDYLSMLTMLKDEVRMKGIVEGMERAITLGGIPSSQPATQPEQISNTPAIPWPDLIEEFYRDNPGHSEKTRESYSITFEQMREVVGVKNVADFTKADVKKYADFLRDKPSKRGGLICRGTIIRHLGEMKFFLKWCVQAGHVEDRGFNDVQARARTQEEKLTRQEDKRRAFTDKELSLFFDSPLFNGYKSLTSRSKPGYKRDRIPDFWFFCIMAFTGSRVGEIFEAPAKLYDLDGIPCLDLREAGTKTHNSPRLIPILPELRRLGFIQHAKKQEMDGLGLVEYRRRPMNADSWSKRLNRYIDDIGIKDDNVVAYSFRHTFRQMLRVSGLNMEIINKIFGHETGETGAGYGSNLSKGEAQQFLEKVKFPVHLDHLFVYGTPK